MLCCMYLETSSRYFCLALSIILPAVLHCLVLVSQILNKYNAAPRWSVTSAAACPVR